MTDALRGVHWGALLALVAFYGLMYAVGRTAARRHSTGTADDLMLARRSMPLWLGVCTMSATWVGGGYINGTAEATYGEGLVWAQAPWGYALSLVVGGVFFARVMRRHRFTTMLDPLEARYGTRVAAVLYLPALTGELFWTGAILTALGTTLGTVLGLDFGPAIVLSAAVAVGYTLTGGLWAVALTDVLQLGVFLVGLWLVVPILASQVGGLDAAWGVYAQNPERIALFPPGAAGRIPRGATPTGTGGIRRSCSCSGVWPGRCTSSASCRPGANRPRCICRCSPPSCASWRRSPPR